MSIIKHLFEFIKFINLLISFFFLLNFSISLEKFHPVLSLSFWLSSLKKKKPTSNFSNQIGLLSNITPARVNPGHGMIPIRQ